MTTSHDGNFYRLLFGENASADDVLAALHLTRDDIERYRDADVIERETDEWHPGRYLRITTRTGGGNRDDYANEKLTSHPLYQFDEDDDFDSTYAYYYFAMPEGGEEPTQP